MTPCTARRRAAGRAHSPLSMVKPGCTPCGGSGIAPGGPERRYNGGNQRLTGIITGQPITAYRIDATLYLPTPQGNFVDGSWSGGSRLGEGRAGGLASGAATSGGILGRAV